MRILDASDGVDVAACLERDEFFWLDMADPEDRDLDELAGELGWHPLALEDAKEFGQRPKLDDYERHALLVFYGVHPPEGTLTEVHVFVSGEWVVTVRRSACNPLEQLRERLRDGAADTEEEVVYRILDVLTDSFLPVVHAIDERLEALEEAIMAEPRDDQIKEIIALRREVGPLRRAATAERDMFHSFSEVVERLPGLERDDARNQFRDIADHLARIADQLEVFRDRLASDLDLYATQNANRLNEVTERLTLVATIFLPLSFVVGFFGQNFKWLTDHIDSFTTFLLYGVGGMVVPLAIMLVAFARAGLLGRR